MAATLPVYKKLLAVVYSYVKTEYTPDQVIDTFNAFQGSRSPLETKHANPELLQWMKENITIILEDLKTQT